MGCGTSKGRVVDGAKGGRAKGATEGKRALVVGSYASRPVTVEVLYLPSAAQGSDSSLRKVSTRIKLNPSTYQVIWDPRGTEVVFLDGADKVYFPISSVLRRQGVVYPLVEPVVLPGSEEAAALVAWGDPLEDETGDEACDGWRAMGYTASPVRHLASVAHARGTLFVDASFPPPDDDDDAGGWERLGELAHASGVSTLDPSIVTLAMWASIGPSLAWFKATLAARAWLAGDGNPLPGLVEPVDAREAAYGGVTGVRYWDPITASQQVNVTDDIVPTAADAFPWSSDMPHPTASGANFAGVAALWLALKHFAKAFGSWDLLAGPDTPFSLGQCLAMAIGPGVATTSRLWSDLLVALATEVTPSVAVLVCSELPSSSPAVIVDAFSFDNSDAGRYVRLFIPGCDTNVIALWHPRCCTRR
ncbi:uncharacterized protein AMSG_01301 [Thecamonas trahens ATCC 50062]|uniref:Uncharacterized protein n=1 Tax=Thecamonas trahens ATCC 50062 TaxID=461836 RepID=A0A0L0DNL9_THETB|nr:hypothetical protein AMSG_01301 [Thecamonas trahens ATCC 50062]KNC53591.1 hypothetical protein AMSG_01301 [Thecamonas trahens ATCC 50062]|eukprot:XP_013761908.1 hypothetical protein AMSG_01301 [Thecamonas trahens ATCC 50062]